ncbi:MAG: T9SS type A sorting domain-containing protein, partial [Planctomycetes bacterium]|nr:T9SS type A sorting domain-containing protein [Planctomycetota bacterium]
VYYHSGPVNSPALYNSIIWDNTVNSSGAQIYLAGTQSDPDFYYCDIQGGRDGIEGPGSGDNYSGDYENNLDLDPLFTTWDQSFSLEDNSPCINMGMPDTTGLNLPETDLAGNPRMVNGLIDIGAYENQFYLTSLDVSGDVFGIWDADTIRVVADITIPLEQTLTILPGIHVEFQNHYLFRVPGQLLAIGTESDSITFTVNDTTGFSNPDIPDGGWQGIRFNQAVTTEDTSRIIYCRLEYSKTIDDTVGGAIGQSGVGALYVSHCFITNNRARGSNIIGGGIGQTGSGIMYVSHCFITNNRALGVNSIGGGIGISGPGVSYISHCFLTNNRASGLHSSGGGIGIESNTATTIEHSNISYNYATFSGGGISIDLYSNPVLINNNISFNSVGSAEIGSGGGGLSITWYSNPDVIGNLITFNSAWYGGGILIYGGCYPTLINNTIAGNSANFGGAIYSWGDFDENIPTFINTITWDNTAVENGNQVYLQDDLSDPNFQYCTIQGGSAAFGGPGAGANYSGDYENNQDSDPLFLGNGDNPYQLQQISPCVDSGSADIEGLYLPELDLASNPRVYGIIDIGSFEWNPGQAIEVDLPVIDHQTITLYQNYPNPFNPITTIQFALPNPLLGGDKGVGHSPLIKGAGGLSVHSGTQGIVSLHIYDINGRLVKTLLDNEPYEPGYHSIQWNGCNGNGTAVSSGMYFYKIVAGAYNKTKRMTLLK